MATRFWFTLVLTSFLAPGKSLGASVDGISDPLTAEVLRIETPVNNTEFACAVRSQLCVSPHASLHMPVLKLLQIFLF